MNRLINLFQKRASYEVAYFSKLELYFLKIRSQIFYLLDQLFIKFGVIFKQVLIVFLQTLLYSKAGERVKEADLSYVVIIISQILRIIILVNK